MPQEGLPVDYSIVPSNQLSHLLATQFKTLGHRVHVSVLPLCTAHFILICTGSWAQTAAQGRNKPVVLPVLCDQGSFHFVCDVRVASLNSVGDKRLQMKPESRNEFRTGFGDISDVALGKVLNHFRP